jgi:hypothetical protein
MKPPQQRSLAGQNPAEDHPQNPEEVYKQDKLCQHFEESHGPSDLPSPAEMLPHFTAFTLPFGIQAFPTLNKPSGPGSAGATGDYNRPSFSSQSVTGGYQISLRAVDPTYPDYPSFQGYTVQLENGLYNGVSTGMSVLGPDVDAIFNPYLGPGGTRPMVPVTRVDLSGYGESLFSDWRNQTNDITAVSKARYRGHTYRSDVRRCPEFRQSSAGKALPRMMYGKWFSASAEA